MWKLSHGHGTVTVVLLGLTTITWMVISKGSGAAGSMLMKSIAMTLLILVHFNSIYILYGLDNQDDEIEERERKLMEEQMLAATPSAIAAAAGPPIQEIDPSKIQHAVTSMMTEDSGDTEDGDEDDEGHSKDHNSKGIEESRSDNTAWNLYLLRSMPSSYNSDIHLQTHPEDAYRLGFDYGCGSNKQAKGCRGGGEKCSDAARAGRSNGSWVTSFFMYYACYFILVTLQSSSILISSLQQHHPAWNTNYDSWDFSIWKSNKGCSLEYWLRVLCWISYGMYIGGATISYIHRHWMDDVLLKRSKLSWSLSIATALVCFLLAYSGYRVHSKVRQDVNSFLSTTTSSGSPASSSNTVDDDMISNSYYGDAWVVDYEILTEDGNDAIVDQDQVEEKYLHNGGIPVNVTVFWGGNWACPTNSELYCNKTLTTHVSLTYWDSFLMEYKQAMEEADEENGDINGEYGENSENLVDMYVYHRYHSSYTSDANDSNENEGSEDENNQYYDEAPSHIYWNRPAETVWVTCDNTCSVKSSRWVGEHFATYSNTFHGICVSFGIGLLFLAWPIYMLGKESEVITKLSISPEPGPLETTLVPKDSAMLA